MSLRTESAHHAHGIGFLCAALTAAALVLSPTLASAEEDTVGNQDFLFGQTLAKEGKRLGRKVYFKYARRVYENILKDSARSDSIKDLARYGLAELNSEAAIGAMGRDIPYKEVVKLIREACDALEAFAGKYPNHPRANDAKLKVGTTRLGFVQWARDTLLPDGELMGERGTDEGEVASDAKSFVGIAINHFDKLRDGHDAREPTDLALRAQFSWVLSQFYRALVMPRCSTDAMEAFTEAEKHLDEYALLNDGRLAGVFALDILGLNWQEKAKCETDEKAQAHAYTQALINFGSCMDTPNESTDHLDIITRGFYHFARACRAAGRLHDTDFLKMGVQRVGPMLQMQPQAWRTSNGVNALIELGLLHAAREHLDKAIDTLTLAADKAKATGNGYLERRANEQLKKIMSGGGAGNADPEVLKRVADAFFAEKRYAEAALAYQAVAASAPRTEAAFKAYLTDAWKRMSSAYSSMGDPIASALALEPLHEAWIDGVFSNNGTPDDPNLREMGDQRYRAIGIWRKLGEQSGSRTFQTRAQTMLRDFKKDYPKHPRGDTGEWTVARQAFSKALKQKQAKKSGWRKELSDAESAFRNVAKDEKSPFQHEAWVYLIQAASLRDGTDDMVKIGSEALALWNSDAVKQRAKEFTSVAGKIKESKGKLKYWLAKAQVEKSQWDAVLKTLDGYHADHENLRGKPVYYSGALGQLVRAHLGKDNITKADEYFRRLVKVDPEYFGLPGIAQSFASFYNDKAKSLETQLTALVREGKDLKPRISAGEKKLYAMLDARSNTRARLNTAKNAVKIWEEAEAADQLAGLKGLTRTQYEKYKDSIPVIEKELKELQERINKHAAEQEKRQGRMTDLLAEMDGLKGQLYEPRSKAAGYFYELYKALLEAKKAPIASNVKVFGDLYRRAGKLKPDVRLNWDRARELYEDFIKMKGADPASVQEAMGYLGGIYYRLASSAEDEQTRRDLVQLARDRLQTAIAKVKDNVTLVLSQLVGDYGVLSWTSDVDNQRYMFTFPKGIKSVAEFKRLVSQMGNAGGPMFPKFGNAADNRRYEQAMTRFKAYIETAVSERQLKTTAASFKRPSADPNFYRVHGNTNRDFRLALAWVYSATGELEDYPKAVALANGLSRGGLALRETTEDWWLARVILLEALTGWAEKASKSDAALAKTLTERASKSLAGLKNSFPTLGKNDRPETPKELQGLLQRIERLRLQLDMKPLNLVLTPQDAVGDPDDQPKKDDK